MNKLRFYLSFLLLGFYLTVGSIFIFSDVWADLLPNGRYLTGFILILFGILRFYISYRRYLNKNTKISELLKKDEKPKE